MLALEPGFMRAAVKNAEFCEDKSRSRFSAHIKITPFSRLCYGSEVARVYLKHDFYLIARVKNWCLKNYYKFQQNSRLNYKLIFQNLYLNLICL